MKSGVLSQRRLGIILVAWVAVLAAAIALSAYNYNRQVQSVNGNCFTIEGFGGRACEFRTPSGMPCVALNGGGLACDFTGLSTW